MNMQHSLPSNVPRKELINRLQKSVLALLFILALAFAGLYVLMNVSLEKQDSQQEKLNELVRGVHAAEEQWLQWLLIEEKKLYSDTVLTSTYYHHVLTSEYRLIEQKLSDFNVLFDSSTSLAFLEMLNQRELDTQPLLTKEREIVYLLFSSLENLDNDLLKIGVDLDYERQLLTERLLWLPVIILLLLTFIVVVMAVRFSRQLSSGFSSLHYVLDHHKHGHAVLVAPRNVVDEFSDLGHFIDNELESRNIDLKHKDKSFGLIEKFLSKVSEPFFVTNNEGDIVWMSSGAEKLWFKNTELFESMFGIDSGLDNPIGEPVAESFLQHSGERVLKLSDGVYCLDVRRLVLESENDNLQCFISLKLKSETAEVDVLHHSLKLMEQDVWSVPVRALRNGSPYESFAVSLEIVREKVSALLGLVNESFEQSPTYVKITKLQQIASLIDEKNTHNSSSLSDVPVVPESFFAGAYVELNEVILLSEQIRDSLLLGYELILQRLSLVEKDLSSDVSLLEDVERCLNEVRAGVLSSLSAAGGESDDVRRRFSIDIEHDISNVQSQIRDMKSMASSTLTLLGSDQSVGVSRLNRASLSIDEIIEKIHQLMKNIPNASINSGDHDIIENSNNACDDF